MASSTPCLCACSVGVLRRLQLGVTLIRDGDSFTLDLTAPGWPPHTIICVYLHTHVCYLLAGSHKSSAIFGPSKTTLGKEICDAITAVLALEKADDNTTDPFLFHGTSGAATPFSPAGWCQLIKSVFKRHSGVALSPKDLRSSFITFLRSSQNNEALLKSCAVAMRHSNAMQESLFPHHLSARPRVTYSLFFRHPHIMISRRMTSWLVLQCDSAVHMQHSSDL